MKSAKDYYLSIESSSTCVANAATKLHETYHLTMQWDQKHKFQQIFSQSRSFSLLLIGRTHLHHISSYFSCLETSPLRLYIQANLEADGPLYSPFHHHACFHQWLLSCPTFLHHHLSKWTEQTKTKKIWKHKHRVNRINPNQRPENTSTLIPKTRNVDQAEDQKWTKTKHLKYLIRCRVRKPFASRLRFPGNREEVEQEKFYTGRAKFWILNRTLTGPNLRGRCDLVGAPKQNQNQKRK